MSEFYNAEYLSERLAAVCRERDELRREAAGLKKIVEKQARMNRAMAQMALELDNMTAQRDALLDEIRGFCNLCKHWVRGDGDGTCIDCAWDKNWEWRGMPLPEPPKEEV